MERSSSTEMLSAATTSNNHSPDCKSKCHFYSNDDEGFCVTRPALGNKRRPLTVSVQSFLDHTYHSPVVSLETINISSGRVRLPTPNTTNEPYTADTSDTDVSQSTLTVRQESTEFGSEKAHKCQYCPRSFILKANLETHMKIHGVIQSNSPSPNSLKSMHIRAQELKKFTDGSIGYISERPQRKKGEKLNNKSAVQSVSFSEVDKKSKDQARKPKSPSKKISPKRNNQNGGSVKNHKPLSSPTERAKYRSNLSSNQGLPRGQRTNARLHLESTSPSKKNPKPLSSATKHAKYRSNLSSEQLASKGQKTNAGLHLESTSNIGQKDPSRSETSPSPASLKPVPHNPASKLNLNSNANASESRIWVETSAQANMSSSSDRYKCIQCPKMYLSPRELNRHQLQMHPVKGQHGVTTAESAIVIYRSFNSNGKTLRKYKCKICQRFFTKMSSAKRHVAVIHGTRKNASQAVGPRARGKSGPSASTSKRHADNMADHAIRPATEYFSITPSAISTHRVHRQTKKTSENKLTGSYKSTISHTNQQSDVASEQSLFLDRLNKTMDLIQMTIASEGRSANLAGDTRSQNDKFHYENDRFYSEKHEEFNPQRTMCEIDGKDGRMASHSDAPTCMASRQRQAGPSEETSGKRTTWVKCKLCLKTYVNPGQFKRHYKKYHPQQMCEMRPGEAESNEIEFLDVFVTGLKRPGRLPCPQCPRSYKRRCDLRCHFKKSHDAGKYVPSATGDPSVPCTPAVSTDTTTTERGIFPGSNRQHSNMIPAKPKAPLATSEPSVPCAPIVNRDASRPDSNCKLRPAPCRFSILTKKNAPLVTGDVPIVPSVPRNTSAPRFKCHLCPVSCWRAFDLTCHYKKQHPGATVPEFASTSKVSSETMSNPSQADQPPNIQHHNKLSNEKGKVRKATKRSASLRFHPCSGGAESNTLNNATANKKESSTKIFQRESRIEAGTSETPDLISIVENIDVATDHMAVAKTKNISFDKRRKKIQSTPEPAQRKKRPTIVRRRYKCGMCHKRFHRKPKVDRHIRRYHSDDIKLLRIAEDRKEATDLHFKTKTETSTDTMPNQMATVATENKAMSQIAQIETEDTYFECETCDATFKRKIDFENHLVNPFLRRRARFDSDEEEPRPRKVARKNRRETAKHCFPNRPQKQNIGQVAQPPNHLRTDTDPNQPQGDLRGGLRVAPSNPGHRHQHITTFEAQVTSAPENMPTEDSEKVVTIPFVRKRGRPHKKPPLSREPRSPLGPQFRPSDMAPARKPCHKRGRPRKKPQSSPPEHPCSSTGQQYQLLDTAPARKTCRKRGRPYKKQPTNPQPLEQPFSSTEQYQPPTRKPCRKRGRPYKKPPTNPQQKHDHSSNTIPTLKSSRKRGRSSKKQPTSTEQRDNPLPGTSPKLKSNCNGGATYKKPLTSTGPWVGLQLPTNPGLRHNHSSDTSPTAEDSKLDGPVTLTCKKCSMSFASLRNLVMHCNNEHYSKKAAKSDETEKSGSNGLIRTDQESPIMKDSMVSRLEPCTVPPSGHIITDESDERLHSCVEDSKSSKQKVETALPSGPTMIVEADEPSNFLPLDSRMGMQDIDTALPSGRMVIGESDEIMSSCAEELKLSEHEIDTVPPSGGIATDTADEVSSNSEGSEQCQQVDVSNVQRTTTSEIFTHLDQRLESLAEILIQDTIDSMAALRTGKGVKRRRQNHAISNNATSVNQVLYDQNHMNDNALQITEDHHPCSGGGSGQAAHDTVPPSGKVDTSLQIFHIADTDGEQSVDADTTPLERNSNILVAAEINKLDLEMSTSDLETGGKREAWVDNENIGDAEVLTEKGYLDVISDKEDLASDGKSPETENITTSPGKGSLDITGQDMGNLTSYGKSPEIENITMSPDKGFTDISRDKKDPVSDEKSPETENITMSPDKGSPNIDLDKEDLTINGKSPEMENITISPNKGSPDIGPGQEEFTIHEKSSEMENIKILPSKDFLNAPDHENLTIPVYKNSPGRDIITASPGKYSLDVTRSDKEKTEPTFNAANGPSNESETALPDEHATQETQNPTDSKTAPTHNVAWIELQMIENLQIIESLLQRCEESDKASSDKDATQDTLNSTDSKTDFKHNVESNAKGPSVATVGPNIENLKESDNASSDQDATQETPNSTDCKTDFKRNVASNAKGPSEATVVPNIESLMRKRKESDKTSPDKDATQETNSTGCKTDFEHNVASNAKGPSEDTVVPHIENLIRKCKESDKALPDKDANQETNLTDSKTDFKHNVASNAEGSSVPNVVPDIENLIRECKESDKASPDKDANQETLNSTDSKTDFKHNIPPNAKGPSVPTVVPDIGNLMRKCKESDKASPDKDATRETQNSTDSKTDFKHNVAPNAEGPSVATVVPHIENLIRKCKESEKTSPGNHATQGALYSIESRTDLIQIKASNAKVSSATSPHNENLTPTPTESTEALPGKNVTGNTLHSTDLRHNEATSVTCKMCHKAFTDESGLATHMKFHSLWDNITGQV